MELLSLSSIFDGQFSDTLSHLEVLLLLKTYNYINENLKQLQINQVWFAELTNKVTAGMNEFRRRVVRQ